jgi:two-component system nitrate/nitrite response regulator NarL
VAEAAVPQPVRVVLADDHDAFVEGLAMVLSAEGDLEVVAVAGDGAAALAAVVAHRPDVLVADTQMPGPAAGELVGLVGQAEPATRVLLLAEDTRQPAPATVSRAASARELADAIRAVAAGRLAGAVLDPSTAPARVPAGATPRRRDRHAELLLRSLSGREREILALVSRGYSNPRIAEACSLSLNTVRTHIQNLLAKLAVHSKLEAAALAVRKGLVTIEEPRPAPGQSE